MEASTTIQAQVPYRQIRALYDDDTITVYQAYSASIADAAVREQRLSASPDFKFTRMTWIKPSWCWAMYRSGYATKDAHQSRILALKMRHQDFCTLLSHASLSHPMSHSQSGSSPLSRVGKERPVRVQWDPERDAGLRMLPYRSIQIGIGREVVRQWVDQWIVQIDDVTEKAAGLRALLDKNEVSVDLEELASMVPTERVYNIPAELRVILGMDIDVNGGEKASEV